MAIASSSFNREHPSDLGHFELNLETWRQLWRVVELSDVLLIVADARYPPAMLPRALLNHARALGRGVVAVLNKADLVDRALAVAWKRELEREYPGVKVAYFTSCPSYNLVRPRDDEAADGLVHRRLRGRIRMVKEGARQVHTACKDLVQGKVDLSDWLELIESEGGDAKAAPKVPEDDKKGEEEKSGPEKHVLFRNGVLTVGMLGQPNAGKSSLINSLMGKRVVSVSKTPGHTKHFQTIFVTK